MTSRASLQFEVGQEIDRRYFLRRQIARGGMAVLFEATQVHSGRRLVIKSLVEELTLNAAARARLVREGKALEMCRSPFVVDGIDVGFEEDLPFLALELLEGRSLDGLLTARTRLPLAASVGILTELCEALEVVHRAGLVHRDVKPSNLFIVREKAGSERLKLLDFGIAGFPDEDGAGKLTRIGERVGTREYMPFEQLMTAPTDARSDLYSAMVVFFECVTGEVPIRGPRYDDPPRRIAQVMAGLPWGLDEVVARGLAREPRDRFGSAREMAEAVRAVAGEGQVASLLAPQPPAAAPQARVFARAPYVTPCRVVDAEQRTFDGRLADVSEGGVLALFPATPAMGKAVQLRFCLPVSGRVVTVSAMPRWQRAARFQSAVGLEFDHLPGEVREDVRLFVGLMEQKDSPALAHPGMAT